MNNLIKSQLYQLRKEKVLIIFLIIIIIMEFTAAISESSFGMGTTITADTLLAENGHYLVLVAMAFGLLLTAQVCGSDFNDRTANYELMSGHLRRNVYFSKAVVSLTGGMMGTVVAFSVPFMFNVARWGWGTDLDVKGVLVRYLLLIFPVFRIICEFVFLSFLIKNSYVVMAMGFIVPIGLGQSLVGYFPDCKSVLLGLTNIYKLAVFPSWMGYTGADLKYLYVYDTSLSLEDIILTVVASLAIGSFFLWLGYQYFKNDDMR